MPTAIDNNSFFVQNYKVMAARLLDSLSARPVQAADVRGQGKSVAITKPLNQSDSGAIFLLEYIPYIPYSNENHKKDQEREAHGIHGVEKSRRNRAADSAFHANEEKSTAVERREGQKIDD